LVTRRNNEVTCPCNPTPEPYRVSVVMRLSPILERGIKIPAALITKRAI
jgi:hypothetical protein